MFTANNFNTTSFGAVFVVTDVPFAASGDPIKEKQALRLLRKGTNRLPTKYKRMKFSQSYGVDALIYEFQKRSRKRTAEVVSPGRLGPRVHFVKAGLAAAFRLGGN